jgi:hypothetical protein
VSFIAGLVKQGSAKDHTLHLVVDIWKEFRSKDEVDGPILGFQ